MTEMFGGDVEGWGGGGALPDPAALIGDATEAGLEEKRPDEHLPDSIDLGGGIMLRINPEFFKMIMHSPEVTAQVDARCEAIAEEANSIAVRKGAEYGYVVSNNPDNLRARGRVKPLNQTAVFDDDENSTLLKALATVGSDPKPPTEQQEEEEREREEEEYESEPEPVAEGEIASKAAEAEVAEDIIEDLF
jgi:hypothetical protein